jgi:hypothetical protein
MSETSIALLIVFFELLFFSIIVTAITIYNQKHQKSIEIIQEKINNDDNTEVDISTAVQYLKLTNNLHNE